MSTLADLLVGHGPFVAGDVMPDWMRRPKAADYNELRDELIAARKMTVDLAHFRDEWTTQGDSTWRWINRIIHGYAEPHEPWTEAEDVSRWLDEDEARP